MSQRSKTAVRRTLRAFAFELVIYAALVTGYFFAVLHFLGGWLVQLETQHIRVYAVVAILKPNSSLPLSVAWETRQVRSDP